MLKETTDILKKFDLFGQPLTFEENDSRTFKTSLGSCFSYLILVFTAIMGFIFGQEIYKRETPNIVTGGEIVGRNGSIVYMTDFPMIMANCKRSGEAIDDYRTLFNVEFWYSQTSKEGVFSAELYYGLPPCNVDIFPDELKPLVQQMISNSESNTWKPYCFIHEGKEDFYFSNSMGVPDSTYLYMKITDCDENYRNVMPYLNKDKEIYTTAPACDPNRFEILDYFGIKIDMVNSMFNFKSYENPELNFLYALSQSLGYGMTNSFTLIVGIEKLISDNGWLLENNEESRIVKLNSITSAPFLMSSDKEIFILGVGVNNQITNNYRSYMKIQELLAKIGGLFNGFFLVLNILLSDFVKFKFRIDYSDYTIDAVDLEKNKTLFPEINNYKKSFVSNNNINQVFSGKSNTTNLKNKQMNTERPSNEIIKALSNSNLNLNLNYNDNSNNNSNNKSFKGSKEQSSKNSGNCRNNNSNNSVNINKGILNKFEKENSENKNAFTYFNYNIPSNNFKNLYGDTKLNNYVGNNLKSSNSIHEVPILQLENKKISQEKLEKNEKPNYDNELNMSNNNSHHVLNKLRKLSTTNNFIFEDNLDLQMLNKFLIDKVNRSNYISYLFVNMCGCCYKNKPLYYQIINSEYSKVKYSFKYFLQENKKFKCFERNIAS